MSLPTETLRSLFDMGRDPVLGVDDQQTVVFANPPASALLGVRVGDCAKDAVPEYILTDPADCFITSVRIGVKRANVYVRKLEEVTLCTYTLPQTEPPAIQPTAAALRELSSDLMSTRLAIDALVRHTKAENDPASLQASEMLYQSYHRLLRTYNHMSLRTNAFPIVSNVVDLGETCRELCDSLSLIAIEKGISLLFKADFGMYLTVGDNNLLEIMLSNLIVNSFQHCGSGDKVHVELSRQDGRFIIAIRDTGTGISPERLTAIFNGASVKDPADPASGSGQGLELARSIAERHDGHMILESRPGEGTSVRISIPFKLSDNMQLNTPMPRYRSSGMSMILTEFSVWLDKKYYTSKYFD